MRKFFAIYANIKLTKKPEWLDGFRTKYDKPGDYHVTLKQHCFVEEGKISNIKQKTFDYFASQNIEGHKIELVFDDLAVDPKDDGTTIMLRAHDVPVLVNLQKGLCVALTEYNDYVKPIAQEWEQNFAPHITIASNLSMDQAKETIPYLTGDYVCKGIIEEAVLAIVQGDISGESQNVLEKTIYKL